MNRLTTDTPHGNFETMMNFAYAKNGEVWIRGVGAHGEDMRLNEYIFDVMQGDKNYCEVDHPDDFPEFCLDACFCEFGALFAAATQAAELRARLGVYEDTGLEPEECAKYAQAEKEGRYIVLKEARSAGVHRLEEIARADIEGRLLVLPCGDDVTLEHNGLLYKGDHWNPPTLTAFAADPSTRSGLRLHLFSVEDAEKALGGTNDKP